MSWPLNNLPANHLNKPAARFLSKFFIDWELTSHLDLEMWHYDRHGSNAVSNLIDLKLYEAREIYLLALYAGSEMPSLKHGYDKRYELETVGGALTKLDVSRLMVCHPNATGFDQLLEKVIETAYQPVLNIYEWLDFQEQMFVDQRRFRFGYEKVIQAITVRALALHADPAVQRTDSIKVELDYAHCEALTSFDADPKSTAAGLAALIETISSIKDRSQPAQWAHSLIRRFSGLYAHLWRLQGHSIESVVDKLRSRLQLVVPTILPQATGHQVDWIIRTTMACYVAPFPHAWAYAGVEVGDFLGCSLLDDELFGNVRAAAYNTALDPFVRKEPQGHQFPKLALDFIGKADPQIYNPHLVDREGSRVTPWNKRVTGLAEAHEKLNLMMEREVWHHALEGEKVVGVMQESAAIEAIKQYLQTGGKANQARAEALIKRYPGLADVFARTVTRGSEVKRLAAIVRMTREQLQSLPGNMRDAVFTVDLGL